MNVEEEQIKSMIVYVGVNYNPAARTFDEVKTEPWT